MRRMESVPGGALGGRTRSEMNTSSEVLAINRSATCSVIISAWLCSIKRGGTVPSSAFSERA